LQIELDRDFGSCAMEIEEFRQQNPQQIKGYPLALQALWHDYQGNWHKSHKLIDHESDKQERHGDTKLYPKVYPLGVL
jgi:hypothetical protein